MNKEKNFAEDYLTQRFYKLNFCVTVILVLAIFVSVYQFGYQTWQVQKQVALIIPGVKENAGWDRSQYSAVKSVCDESGFSLVLRENVPADYASCKKVVDELSKGGVTAICFTNGCKLSDLKDFEKQYPRISFCTIESISALWNGGSYSILSFEGSYLAGILAGLHTKTNKIGYVAPFLDSEVNQGINAFTLGVQRVNPDAEVLLDWTGSWESAASDEQAVQNLKAQSVDVLTYHENGATVPNTAERAGIFFIAFNEVYPNHNYYLGSIKIDWKSVYSEILRYSKSLGNGLHNTYGISQKIVDLTVTNKLSTREKVLVETAKWELQHGRIIFGGDIFDRNGIRKCSANETISFQKLRRNMNWLVKGVKIVGT